MEPEPIQPPPQNPNTPPAGKEAALPIHTEALSAPGEEHSRAPTEDLASPAAGNSVIQNEEGTIDLIPEQSEKALSAPAPIPVQEKKAPVAIEDILLPQTGAPSRISTMRRNAGEAFAAGSAPLVLSEEKAPKLPVPETRSETLPLHTYKTDVESAVREKNISVVDIATAEADRRAKEHPASKKPFVVPYARIAEILAGLLLMAAALGGFAYVSYRFTALSPTQQSQVPFIYVDSTETIALTPGETRQAFMARTTQMASDTAISLGLISRLYPVLPPTASSTSNAPTALGTQDFFSLVAPDAPASLVRALDPQFLLGIHSFAGNDPFLLLKTNSYDQAFAGMLQWEPSMQADLFPFFPLTVESEPIAPSSGTTTSTVAPQILTSGFSDAIVENHDARVIKDSGGTIVLLWTFLDRNTLLVANSTYTVREIISRLSSASTVPIPGQ